MEKSTEGGVIYIHRPIRCFFSEVMLVKMVETSSVPHPETGGSF